MTKITNNDFLDIKSSFCNQDYSKINEKAYKIAEHRLLRATGSKHYSETFFQGTAIEEVKPVCLHPIYTVKLEEIKKGYMFSSAIVEQFDYLFVNKDSEMIASMTLDVYKEDVGFRRLGTGGPGTHSIARIITETAKKPELEGYEFRALAIKGINTFGFRAVWLHNEDPEREDFVVPLFSDFSYEEGKFYTEKEITDILLNEIVPFFESHGDL